MTERLRDWLPLEAAARPAVRAQIDELVAAWSSHWFGPAGGLGLSAWGAAGPWALDATWRACEGGLQASCPPRAGLRLACLALGQRADQVDLTERDRLLLAELAQRIVDDLAGRLRARLGAPAGALAGDEPRYVARLSDGDDVLLGVSIPFPLLMRLCRQALPKPRPSPPGRLQLRAQALKPTSVRLEATLGAVRLDLTDLRELAVGDVLVLDRSVTDPIEISVAGAAVGQGVLSEIDGRSALLLQSVE